MTAPSLNVAIQGVGSISADNYNTYEQTCDTAAQLQAFIGTQGIQVYIRGLAAIGDGGQGVFYWNFSGSANDGVNNIQPSGAALGTWTRIPNPPTVLYSYQIPLTGFAITIPNSVGALVLNPAGTLAAGAITMPSAPVDGQIVRCSSTQIVTALTVSANAGQTIDNAPTAFTAGGVFGYIYIQSVATWFRI